MVLTGDKKDNYLGKNYLEPFIEVNNMRVLNGLDCRGVMTFFGHSGGTAIDDLVIVQNISFWDELNSNNSIKMKVGKYLAGSDHAPIFTTIKLYK